MRRGDRRILEDYNEVAKNAAALNWEGEELDQLEQVLDWHLERAAEKQRTSKEAQAEVYVLQAEKQRLMREMHEQLRCLDDPECEPAKEEGARAVVMREGKLFAAQEDGTEIEMTEADLLVDGEWGIRYVLDPQTIDRGLQKRYLVTSARQAIRDLLDHQLLQVYADQELEDPTLQRKKNAYRRTLAYRKEGRDLSEEFSGVTAERMARTFLTRAQMRGELPFLVEFADAYEDVEHKIDYVVARTDHRRGVGVEHEDGPDSVAVQFSQNASHESRKMRQLRRMRSLIGDEIEGIDDYVLLILRGKWASGSLRAWEEAGRPSGGPEQFVRSSIQEALFRRPLEQMFTKEELDQMWEQVSGSGPEALPKAA